MILAWAPQDAKAITPNDTAATNIYDGLLCSVAGNVALTTQGGNNVTIAMAAGQVLLLPVQTVKATGTTATVVGLLKER